MATEMKDLHYDASYIESFSGRHGEPGWFTDLRKKGLELARQLPLPKPEKTRIVGWNFTEFEHDLPTKEVQSVDELPESVKNLVGKGKESGNLLVLHNGHAAYSSLSDDLKAKGVIFTDLATALRDHGDLVQNYYFTKAAKMDAHKLTALNAALVNSGLFLYVPKNVEIDVPLQTVFWHDHENGGLINHVLIVTEANSSVTYVENYLSTTAEGSSVANVISEVYVGENSRVQYGGVENLSSDITTYINRRGYVGRNGNLEWALGQMNDGNLITETYSELAEDGATVDTKAVSIGRGTQKQNFVNRIKHYGKNTTSNMLIHGVQREDAQAIFNGITKIEHGASKSDGEQTQRVLMLSSNARGDANPILLIDEDDVIAGHAASVGRIDPVQLHYLMSRGISRNDAERLIIHGFLEPVVSQLPIEGVKEQLTAVIEGKVR
ncbi:MAG: Fe-S cluster assembly protein SufD [Tuberibacillus sp.]